MTTDDPIPNYDPDYDRTVLDNARMAVAALANATDGPIAQADAEEVVARRVPGGGPEQARIAIDDLDIETAIDPARFMSGGGETA